MNDIIEQLLMLKQISHADYINEYLRILRSFDLSEVDLRDWEKTLLLDEVEKLKRLLWMPKGVLFNFNKPIE